MANASGPLATLAAVRLPLLILRMRLRRWLLLLPWPLECLRKRLHLLMRLVRNLRRWLVLLVLVRLLQRRKRLLLQRHQRLLLQRHVHRRLLQRHKGL